MYCTSCGKELENGTMFCDGCGKKVEPDASLQKGFLSSVGTAVMTKPKNKQKISCEAAQSTQTVIGLQAEKTKTCALKFVYLLSLFVTYATIILVFTWAIQYASGIKISTKFDDDVYKYLSLSEVLRYMYSGCAFFSPTVSSILISVSAYTLLYSLPFISLITFIGEAVSHAKKLWHTALSILYFLCAVTLIAVVPLTFTFVPKLWPAIASDVSLLAEDIAKISFIPITLFGILIFVLIIVSGVLLTLLSRRNKR